MELELPPNRIGELRREAHMTQVRLSIELEVSQETISAYERSRHYPSFPQMVKMSQILNTGIDYMMGLSDVRIPERELKNGSGERMYLLAHRLDPIQAELAAAYMQGMLDFAKAKKLS